MLKKIKKKLKELKRPYYLNKNKKYKKFDIGDYTYGKPKIYADPSSFKLGKFCSIADGVTIYAGGEHNYNWVSSYNFSARFDCKVCTDSKGDVFIGNDVWIGDGSLILSGVNIGNGAVIAAHSVVTKDVNPYEIVGGNPARHIKYRFDQTQINSLLKIKWWDWDIKEIETNFELILNEDINNFINKFKD